MYQPFKAMKTNVKAATGNGKPKAGEAKKQTNTNQPNVWVISDTDSDSDSDSSSLYPSYTAAPKSLTVKPMDHKQRGSLKRTAPSVPAPFPHWVVPIPLSKRRKSLNEMSSTYNNVVQEAPENVHNSNSIEKGRRMLQRLIDPVKTEDFFTDYWEKKACVVHHNSTNFFMKLTSFKVIDDILYENHLQYNTNIDVTKYIDGKIETQSPEGREIESFYNDGYTIRILNAFIYFPELRHVCSKLQEFFHSSIGANLYLTPPNSPEFPPHSDDFESFVLQIEGRRRWHLDMPLPFSEELPGAYGCLLDTVLEPGDVVYIPRGTIHRAVTTDDSMIRCDGSMYIILSVNQQQAYANLLEHLMPRVLQRAVKQSLTMRRGLPLYTWKNLGFGISDRSDPNRGHFIRNVQKMVKKYLVPTVTEIDWAVDQMAKKFQHEALPPTIPLKDRMHTVHAVRSFCGKRNYELTDRTSIRLLRANILRLVGNEDNISSVRIYYNVDNAPHRKNAANFMEIKYGEAGAVMFLMDAYPDYIKVSRLPIRNAGRRIKLATALWERGLLMTKKPLE